jgi:hypothetical protein
MVKQDLVTAYGPPTGETPTSDGATRMTLWKDKFGPGTVLLLIDSSPKSRPGAMVYYQAYQPARP